MLAWLLLWLGHCELLLVRSSSRTAECRAEPGLLTQTDTPASLSPPALQELRGWELAGGGGGGVIIASLAVTNININQHIQSPVWLSTALALRSCPGGDGGGGGGNVCLATVQTRWRVEGEESVQTQRKGRERPGTWDCRQILSSLLPRFTLL